MGSGGRTRGQNLVRHHDAITTSLLFVDAMTAQKCSGTPLVSGVGVPSAKTSLFRMLNSFYKHAFEFCQQKKKKNNSDSQNRFIEIQGSSSLSAWIDMG